MRRHLRCSIGGSESTNEIPPLGTLLHLSNEETKWVSSQSTGCAPSWFGIIGGRPLPREAVSGRLAVPGVAVVRPSGRASWGPNRDENCTNRTATPRQTGAGSRVLFRDICQMGSLAGAAYLLHDNAGVLRQAQWEQKSHVEHKRKSLLD